MPALEAVTAATPRLALLRMAATAGLLTGLLMCAFLLAVLWFSDTNPLTPIRELAIGLHIIGLIFLFWYIKNGRPLGQFQFWEGLFTGFVLSVVAGLVQGGVTWLQLTYLNPEVLQGYITWSLEFGARNAEYTKEQFNTEAQAALMESIRNMTATDVAKDMAMKRVILSILVVPIVAALMRKTVMMMPGTVPSAPSSPAATASKQ